MPNLWSESWLKEKTQNKASYTLVRDLLYDNDNLSLNGSTFSFAINTNTNTNDSSNIIDQQSYIFVDIQQKYVTQIDNQTYSFNEQEVDYDYWGIGRYFKFDDLEVQKAFGVDQFLCPKSNAFDLQGNVFSVQYNYFEITIKKWENDTRPGVVCKSQSEIDQKINQMSVGVTIVNSYFDFDNYENPVRTYLDDRYVFSTLPYYSKEIRFYMSKNEAEVQDAFFNYAPGGDKIEFVSVNRVDQNLEADSENSGELLKLFFFKDYNYQYYERSVFSLLDLTGNLGGVNEVLEITGGILVGFFADKLFFYSIISSLFQVETLSKNEIESESDKQRINRYFKFKDTKSSKERSETENMPLEEEKSVEKSSLDISF